MSTDFYNFWHSRPNYLLLWLRFGNQLTHFITR